MSIYFRNWSNVIKKNPRAYHYLFISGSSNRLRLLTIIVVIMITVVIFIVTSSYVPKSQKSVWFYIWLMCSWVNFIGREISQMWCLFSYHLEGWSRGIVLNLNQSGCTEFWMLWDSDIKKKRWLFSDQRIYYAPQIILFHLSINDLILIV